MINKVDVESSVMKLYESRFCSLSSKPAGIVEGICDSECYKWKFYYVESFKVSRGVS